MNEQQFAFIGCQLSREFLKDQLFIQIWLRGKDELTFIEDELENLVNRWG